MFFALFFILLITRVPIHLIWGAVVVVIAW